MPSDIGREIRSLALLKAEVVCYSLSLIRIKSDRGPVTSALTMSSKVPLVGVAQLPPLVRETFSWFLLCSTSIQSTLIVFS